MLVFVKGFVYIIILSIVISLYIVPCTPPTFCFRHLISDGCNCSSATEDEGAACGK